MIAGLLRCRNEAWVLAYSFRVLLQWVDAVVVLDHSSTDATPQVLDEIEAEHPGRIVRLHEPRPEWCEMAHFQRLLDAGRSLGGSVFAICDADEILCANLVALVPEMAASLRKAEVVSLPLLNLWRSLDRYRRDESKHGRQWTPVLFRDDGHVGWGGPEQFHHRPPFGVSEVRRWPLADDQGGLLHLQRASWRRAQARQSHYKMVERIRWPDKAVHAIDVRYASALQEQADARYFDVPPAWWAHGLDRSLIDLAAEPWEAAACDALLAEHGQETFRGLELAW